MIIYMRNCLCDVVQHAYPEDYRKYTDFYLNVEFKEKKSAWSKYDFSKKTISVNTLSRKPADIFLSMLQELTKHIDIKIRKETHPDREYYLVFRKLLQSSLQLNLININDLICSKNDKLKKNLQENFGSFSNWNCNPAPSGKYIYIHVFEAFLIKNILKANAYLYDPEQNSWSKKITCSQSDEEQYFIQQYKNQAEFEIISDDRFFIKPVYLIRIATYAVEETKLLKALYYKYNPKKKIWEKIVYAEDVTEEYNQIKDFPHQSITIAGLNKI